MDFLFVLVDVVDGGRVLLEREVIIVVQGHFFLMVATVALDQGLHDLQL